MKENVSTKFTSSIYLLLLTAFIVYVGMSVFIVGPIFGSDEYAYFISGKFVRNINQLYELDPDLQRISNILFFEIIHVINKLAADGFLEAFRIFHALEYILCAYVLYCTFEQSIGNTNAFYGTAIFLILPTSIYIQAVMPEIDLILISALLGFAIIKIYPARPLLGAAISGTFIGIAILLKPHGLALLVATIVTILGGSSLKLTLNNVKIGLLRILVLVGFCYSTMIILWKLCSTQWLVDPTIVLGLKFYGNYIQASSPENTFAHKLILAAYYASAHIIVVALIFSPALILFFRTLKKYFETSWNESESSTGSFHIAIIFVLASLVAHIVMASWFTAGAASANDGEAGRLHGRYLGAAISFLPFLYFYALSVINEKEFKLVNGVIFSSLLLCIFFVFGKFKIFPWDYPILFSFFRASNNYAWDFPTSFKFLGAVLILFVFSVVVVGAFFKKHFKKLLFAQLFVISVAGFAQTYNWAIFHTKNYQNTTHYSALIKTLVAPSNPGDGVFVSNERYGPDSFFLFGLGNAPKVLEKAIGSTVDQNDVSGAKWVIFSHDYQPNFMYANEIQLDQYKLYLIDTKVVIGAKEKNEMKQGQVVDLLLASNHNETKLFGFNEREPWGAWSSSKLVKIEFPFQLKGRFTIKFFAWTLKENLGTPMIIQFGNDSIKVKLSEVGEEYAVTLRADQATDFVSVESSTFHPFNSHRDMGVAISRISIEKVE